MFRSTLQKLAALLLLNLASTIVWAEIRVSGAEFESPEYYYEHGKVAGSFGARFQCILERTALNKGLKILPYTRQSVLFERGEIDVIFPWVATPERSAKFLSSKPVVTIVAALVSSNVKFKTLQDLANTDVATVKGSVFHALVESHHARVHSTYSYQQALDMLKHDRVKAVIIPNTAVPQSDHPWHISELREMDIVFYLRGNHTEHQEIKARLDHAISTCEMPQMQP